jgi:NitT/TauT family transport system substrate-binding protein
MNKTLGILTAVVLLALGATVFLIFKRSEETESGQQKIKIGYLPIAASLPLFVAEEEGYLKKAGLDVELVPFTSSNELALAGASGRVDVMVTCATNAALDAMVTTDKHFEVFLCNGYVKGNGESKSTDYLLGAKGTTLEDLKGQSIAVFPGSVSTVFADLVLSRHGVPADSVKLIEMNPPEWLPALQSGRVIAVNAVEPAATLIIERAGATILIDGYFADFQQNVPLSAQWFAPSAKPAIRHRYLQAMKDALDLISKDRGRATQHFKNFTEIPPEVYEKIGLNNWRLTSDADARRSLESLAHTLKDKGSIKGIPNYPWIYHN